MNITELREKISLANQSYRSGLPIMSDQEYDFLIDELKVLSPEDSLFNEIGYKVSDRKIKIPIEMASMNKVKSIDELKNWSRLKEINTNTIVVLTPKFDGLSLGVNEVTNQAFTRGDGEYGQESSKHFSFISNQTVNNTNLPFEYSYGEVIMAKKTFNEKYSTDFANPRNLVAGLLNSKEVSDSLKDCHYLRYGVQNIHKSAFSTKTQILDFLNNIQEIKVPYKTFRISDLNEDVLFETFKEWSLDFEIDGIIIEVNDLNTQFVLGRETSSNNPVWARAYKHPNFEQSAISEVLDITWNISKQGLLKPIININPIRIDGVTVSNVTGNNARYLKEMGIGIGSVVKVVRSGMVIPKITEVINKVNFIMPNISNIKWDDRNIDLITLSETDDQKFKKVVAFFTILETDNVSEGVLKQLWDSGYKSIDSILNLNKEDLEKLEGFGKRKSSIVYDSIKNSTKDVEMAKLMHASSLFNGLGEKKLALLQHFTEKPSLEDVVTIDGFAAKSAEIFIENYDRFFDFIKNLPITIKKDVIKVSTNLPLDGKTFVFTGIRMKEEEKTIEELGGNVSNSISKNTTYLVCKDPSASSSKLEKARKIGVEIISVEQFIKFLNSIL